MASNVVIRFEKLSPISVGRGDIGNEINVLKAPGENFPIVLNNFIERKTPEFSDRILHSAIGAVTVASPAGHHESCSSPADLLLIHVEPYFLEKILA
jgi:hypothetical protein